MTARSLARARARAASVKQPWASIDEASKYVAELIDEPLWGTLRSKLRLSRAVGLRGRDVVSFLHVQAGIAEVKQRLARTVPSIKRLGLHAPAQVADTAIVMVDELARCFDHLALEGVSAEARADLVGHLEKPFNRSSKVSSNPAAEPARMRERAAALGGAWCATVCRQRPHLAPCLTGTLFAYASIGAQVEQACATAAQFKVRRAWWDRALRPPG